MTTLLKHVQAQQDIATTLCGVIEALSILHNEEVALGAVTSLLNVAGDLAQKLASNLDSVSLPKVAP